MKRLARRQSISDATGLLWQPMKNTVQLIYGHIGKFHTNSQDIF